MTAALHLASGNPFEVPVQFDLPDDRAVQAVPVEGFGSFPERVRPSLSVVGPELVRGKVLISGHTLDAGGSATYGDALRSAVGRGLVVPVLPTSQRTTLAAGLVTNPVSRFSSIYGKVADAVESFELATPDGKRRLIRRPDATTSEENDALFRAVPGGFGFLGAVGRVRTQLMALPAHAAWTTPNVETHTAATRSFAAVVDALVHDHLLMNESILSGVNRPAADGLGTWALTNQDERGIVFRSQYVAGDRPLLPCFLHQPEGASRRMRALAAFSPWMRRLGWRLSWERLSRQDRSFVDTLADFTFTLDGAWRAADTFKRAGATPWQQRQSFVLPLRRNDTDPGRRVKQFLSLAAGALEEGAVQTNPLQLVALPADHYLLSAARGQEGVLVEFSNQGLSEEMSNRFSQVLRRLSRHCADLGGRVQLERGISVEPHVLQQMYGEALSRFRDLKAELDPAGILRNPFVERLLKS